MQCSVPLWVLLVTGLVAAGCDDGGASTGGDGGDGGAGGLNGGVTADAGADQEVAEGTVLTLEGAGSGPSFSWTQLSGPDAILDGADAAAVRFDAPWIVEESATIELELTVSDGADIATDTAVITVMNTHFAIFLSDKDQAGRVELYRASLDEEVEPIKLSQTPLVGGDVISFEISPDGRYVAYDGAIEQPGVNELFVVATSGGDPSKINGDLVSGGNVSPSFEWSPDSSRIAYLADQETDEVFELYASAPDGSGNVKLNGALVDGGNVLSSGLAWSPDSTRIAYRADQETDEVFELYSSTPNGSANVKLNGPLVQGGNVPVFAFRWNPDSSRIAYLADQETDEVFELYTSAPDGTSNVKLNGALVMGGSVIRLFEWSPDGSRVAYIADQETDEMFELYGSAPDGTGNVRVNAPLIADGDVSGRIEWSPDSSRIAYLADQETDEVFEVYSSAPDGAGNVRLNGALVMGGSVPNSHSWSPDGSRIAYTADQGTDEVVELYTSLPDGTGNARINGDLVTGGAVRGFIWAPNSNRIGYRADQETDEVVEVYSAASDGTDGRRASGMFVVGGTLGPNYNWSGDSARIVYSADQEIDEVVELYSSAPDGTDNIKLSGVLAPGATVRQMRVE